MLEDVVGYALLLAIVLMIVGSMITNYRRRRDHHDHAIAAPAFSAGHDLHKHED